MSSYADLLARLGDIEARRTAESGRIWSNFAINAGNIPLQIQQQQLLRAREQRLTQQAASEQQLTQLKLQDAQDNRLDQALTGQLVTAHTQSDDNGHLTTDHDAVYQGLLAKGRTKAAEGYLNFADAAQTHANQVQAAVLKTEADKQNWRGEVLSSVMDAPAEQRPARYAVVRGTLSALAQKDPLLSALPPDYPGDDAFQQLYDSTRTHEARLKDSAAAVEEALKRSTTAKNLAEAKKAESEAFAGPKQDEWQAFQKAYAGTHGATTWAELPAARQQQAVADFAALKRDPNKPEPDPGWSTVTMHDDQTGKDTLVRVNSRTGQVQPVTMPAGVSAGKGAKLSAQQQDQIAAFETLKQEGQKVLQLLKDTGLDQSNDPVGPRWNTLIATKLKIAPNDPRVADLIQRIQFVKANAMRALTGSRMSQYVAQQMEPHLPDSVQSGKQAAHVLTNILEQSDERERNLYQAAGVPVPDFIRPPIASSTAPKEGQEGVVGGVPAIWKTVNGKAGWYAK